MDHSQALGLGVISGFDQGGGIVRVGNDDIALGHDAIVAPLERVRLVVSAMVGGHEGHPGASCGKQGAPGGGTAASVDQIHSFACYQLPQCASVRQHP